MAKTFAYCALVTVHKLVALPVALVLFVKHNF